MVLPVILAVVSVATFFLVAHVAVRSSPTVTRVLTRCMLCSAVLVALGSVPAGVAVSAAVLLGRRLAWSPVPSAVPVSFSAR